MGAVAGGVAVVTDSTAGLARLPEAGAGVAVGVVPLRVTLGTRTGVDGVDVFAADVITALRARLPVRTSRPSPAQFAREYRRLLDAGASHVVSIHLAAALSGTWESAVLAAQDFGYGTVRVVDSRTTAMGLGYAVLAAAAAAADGADAALVQQAATDVIDSTRTLFYVDTLEYLRRGGRVGTASALLAGSLSMKPLLQMVEGQVVALERVRTTSKALSRLVQRICEAAGTAPVQLAIHHLGAAQRAAVLAEQLRARLPAASELIVRELGPVLGAHLGPGAVGVVIAGAPSP